MTRTATGIPEISTEGIEVIAAAPTVGVLVGASGNFDAVIPETTVMEYMAATPASPYAVHGEIVVGAVLPPTVELIAVPGSAYGYTIVNGACVPST